ncbi:MAG: hypothetical protein JXR07_03030 [Reichenbachiella sp.]
MKTSLLLIFVIMNVELSLLAQDYSGKFKEKPSLNEFEQFIVLHDAVGLDQEDVLSIKAFGKGGELWHSIAYKAEQEIVNEVISNFYKDVLITAVYKLEVTIQTENLHYYLLGHTNNSGQEEFLVIEEFYHGPEDLVHVEVNSFEWAQASAQASTTDSN